MEGAGREAVNARDGWHAHGLAWAWLFIHACSEQQACRTRACSSMMVRALYALRSMPRILTLNGPWLIRADFGNVGLAEKWFHSPDEFLNRELCKAIDVPRAWQHVLGEEYHYLAWYRRRIEIPVEWKHPRTRLRFEAVATEVDTWVNGQHVGHHIGDYIPCEFDCTDHAKPGAVLDVVLRIDAVLGHITKGFHDMLSIHHGGIWDDVSLVGSGAAFARPNGIAVRADARSGEVEIIAELADQSAGAGMLRIEIADPTDAGVTWHETRFDHRRGIAATLAIRDRHLWQPNHPRLYTARIDLIDGSGAADHHEIRFGFRTLEVLGEQMFLNDSPLHVRGILHWGHEPKHLAPAPPSEQVRAEFEYLRKLGFNGVCLCMWYPPRGYFDIADETGMLIWQEHPVWHSPMSAHHLAEYRRLYTEFLRLDRNHPSVIIVSATCEHPSFDPDLGEWWWKTARAMLPGKLLQVQTSSFAWSNPEQTDLYDEHTYDNNNRWVTYLEDLQEKLRELPPKPFIMGESVLFTSWPPFDDIERAKDEQNSRWSRPNYHKAGKAFEAEIISNYGSDVLERFKRQADRHHILGRKFQIEMFRRYPNHVGLVTNHLRDVPGCTCGFMDALGRWRFKPEDTRGWMCDAPLLLATPDERRSFVSRESIEASILVANFSSRRLRGSAVISSDGTPGRIDVDIDAQPGEVARSRFRLTLPLVKEPTRCTLTASLAGTQDNTWDLWVFPAREATPHGVNRMDGLPFEAEDTAPDPLERGYSRGFGLPVRTWVNRLPDPSELVSDAVLLSIDASIPGEARVVLTHRLTHTLVDYLERGGRVVLFASKAAGGLGTSYEWLFGQCPLIIEEGPLRKGDSEWIVDLLSFDLTRTYARVIPIDQFGWRDSVRPLIRLVYTHDAVDLKMFDMLLMARVGQGTLMVSSLDHSFAAGQFLLGRMIEFMSGPDSPSLSGRRVAAETRGPGIGSSAEITADALRQHAIEP